MASNLPKGNGQQGKHPAVPTGHPGGLLGRFVKKDCGDYFDLSSFGRRKTQVSVKGKVIRIKHR